MLLFCSCFATSPAPFCGAGFLTTSIDPPAGSTGTCRHDGWTEDRRRLFLAALSQGHSVERACAHVGMSRDSAYKFRRRDVAFARAWSAACRSARPIVTVPNAFLEGRVRIITLGDGRVVRLHSFDNRGDLARLARLDRRAARDQAIVDAASHGSGEA